MAGNFSEWSPYENYVQHGLADGAFAHGGFTMIAAGPPRLADIGAQVGFTQLLSQGGAAANNIVLPIGLIQNLNLTQSKQFNRIFEMGSDRSYFISGRTVGQLSLGRVYYHGGSLLRMLYSYYQDNIAGPGGVVVPPMFPNQAANLVSNPHDVVVPPGYDNVFINLASDLFSQPVGLLMYTRDSNLRTLQSGYFEHVIVPQHSWAVDSQGLMIQEGAGLQYERIVPINIKDVALVTNQAPYTNRR